MSFLLGAPTGKKREITRTALATEARRVNVAAAWAVMLQRVASSWRCTSSAGGEAGATREALRQGRHSVGR